MPFLALLGGPFGKLALYASAVLAIGAAVLLFFHEHDARIHAEDAARVAAATAREQVRDAQQVADAIAADARANVARASAANAVKLEIAHAAPSSSCASSPAVRAALDGLRYAGAGTGHRPADGAAGTPVLSRPTSPF